MTREDELLLVEKAAGGDADAFEKLVSGFERLVYNISLRMLGNVQDAEDATQEIFMKAYGSLRTFRGDSRLSVWLYRISNNVCIDMLRKRKSRVASVSLEDGDGQSMAAQLPDGSLSPDELLEKKERARALERAIGGLPDSYKSALVLREIGGQSYEEIARTLNVDLGTVKSRIFRARKKLCEMLAGDGNYFGDYPSEKGKEGEQR